MIEFQNKYCTVVRGFLDEITVSTLAKYMRNKFLCNEWDVRSEEFTYENNPSKYYFYADPMAELVLESSVEQVEEAIGIKVFPTYSFSRIYVKGDELTPHIDRPSCEISVTVNLDNVGGLWPIWMKAPEHETIKITLNPGDAVIYRGCEVFHWRDKMVDQESTVQFMLHYVNQDGPHADRKWDKRPGLGYSHKERGN